MTREEAIKFAEHAVNMTEIPEVKEFYRMSAAALRKKKQTLSMCGFLQIGPDLHPLRRESFLPRIRARQPPTGLFCPGHYPHK